MAKHNKKHDTPSNERYIAQNRLKQNKVRRVVKAQGISEKEAEELWEASRKSVTKAKAK